MRLQFSTNRGIAARPRRVVTRAAFPALLLLAMLLAAHPALVAAKVPAPSLKLTPGASGEFAVSGFALQGSLPSGGKIAGLAPNNLRAVLYYGVEWGYAASAPQQVLDALLFVQTGAYGSAGDHTVADRIVAAASANTNPSVATSGKSLLTAADSKQASIALASFGPAADGKQGSGAISVSNKSGSGLQLYLPFGILIEGADGAKAIIWATDATAKEGGDATAPTATEEPKVAATATTAEAPSPTAAPTKAGKPGADATAKPAAKTEATATAAPSSKGKETPTTAPKKGDVPKDGNLNTEATATVPAKVTDTPKPTHTSTPVPPTDTPQPTATYTPEPPKPTDTSTPVPPTATDTPLPPTDTSTPVPPTATNTRAPRATNTPVPPTVTRTAVPTALKLDGVSADSTDSAPVSIGPAADQPTNNSSALPPAQATAPAPVATDEPTIEPGQDPTETPTPEGDFETPTETPTPEEGGDIPTETPTPEFIDPNATPTPEFIDPFATPTVEGAPIEPIPGEETPTDTPEPGLGDEFTPTPEIVEEFPTPEEPVPVDPGLGNEFPTETPDAGITGEPPSTTPVTGHSRSGETTWLLVFGGGLVLSGWAVRRYSFRPRHTPRKQSAES